MKYLVTNRLILRDWKEEDLIPMSIINSDPKVMEYFPKIQDFEYTKKFINYIKEHFKKYGYGFYALELKESSEFIGFVGLNYVTFKAPFTPCVEIGWRLSSKYWGKGYATEAAKYVLKHAFSKLKLNEVVSFTAPNNLKSRKVMEKIGLVRVKNGDFYHPNIDVNSSLNPHVLYKITREDYFAYFK